MVKEYPSCRPRPLSMWQSLPLKLISLILFLLGSSLTISAVYTNHWVTRPTFLGPSNESLWEICAPWGCRFLPRGWVFNIFVVGLLMVGAVYGFTCAAIFMLLFICRKSKGLHKWVSRTFLLPALTTMIGMSVYTGKYTSDVPLEFRGWSFYFAWSSFPLFLSAAIVTTLYQVLHKSEEGE